MSGVVTLGETMGLFVASAVGSLTQVDEFRLRIGGAATFSGGMAAVGCGGVSPGTSVGVASIAMW